MADSRRVTRRLLLKAACVAPFAAKMTYAFAQSEKPLLTRAIPHSGERLPAVGLGTAVSFPSADQQQVAALREVVDALISGGGKLIDTASTYGNAENVIGEIIGPSNARDRLFLATKIEVRSAKDSDREFRRSRQTRALHPERSHAEKREVS